jgi:hypothetical protein
MTDGLGLANRTDVGNNPMPEIRPQRGPQERFLSASADIAIYGGAAGGGYAGLNGGQMLGNIGQGAKRFMQGGTVAPLQIIAPMPNKEAASPLAQAPGEK